MLRIKLQKIGDVTIAEGFAGSIREALQGGIIEGDELILPEPELTQNEPEPTVGQLVENFAEATARWARAGFPVLEREGYLARLARCRACPQGYWNERARFGLGRCEHPDCGCTRFKLWLATEECPLPEPEKMWRKTV